MNGSGWMPTVDAFRLAGKDFKISCDVFIADAGTLQTISVGGINYLTLGVTGGSYADVGKQQYCCNAIAYY